MGMGMGMGDMGLGNADMMGNFGAMGGDMASCFQSMLAAMGKGGINPMMMGDMSWGADAMLGLPGMGGDGGGSHGPNMCEGAMG
mmetsp:Transcript_25655/g.67098  ORF Transcript_25655/g.67098 Transcript_25655/m.67098 type:complete len:84 (-) Transcript_25655:353-604(-)